MSTSAPFSGIRSVLGLFVLAGVACTPEVVTFGNEPIREGQKFSITSSSVSSASMKLTVDGQEHSTTELPKKETFTCTMVVTAVGDQDPSTATLTFGEGTRLESTLMGSGLEEAHPCSGKSVEVKFVKNRSKSGYSTVGGFQDHSVFKLCELALRRPLASRLAGKTMKEGESFGLQWTESKQLLSLFLTGVDPLGLELTLAGRSSKNGADVALFDVKGPGQSGGANEGSSIANDLAFEGEIAVDVKTLRVVSCHLEGTTTFLGTERIGDQRYVRTANGQTTWKYSATAE